MMMALTPMGVGGWQSVAHQPYWPPIPSRFHPGVVPECRRPCCEPHSSRVRELVRFYGSAFFSDGMGV